MMERFPSGGSFNEQHMVRASVDAFTVVTACHFGPTLAGWYQRCYALDWFGMRTILNCKWPLQLRPTGGSRGALHRHEVRTVCMPIRPGSRGASRYGLERYANASRSIKVTKLRTSRAIGYALPLMGGVEHMLYLRRISTVYVLLSIILHDVLVLDCNSNLSVKTRR